MSDKDQEQKTSVENSATRKPWSLWTKLGLGVFALLLLSGLVTIFRVGAVTYDFVKNPDDLFKQLPKLIGSELKKSNDRTNILLVGAGDLSYDEGSELTDSIILVSLNHKDNSVSMVSVPRDLGVEIPSYGFSRINVLYKLAKNHFGNEHAFELLIPAIETITCQHIDYYAKVDFIGFKKIINALGGVTVDVATSFTDIQFPTENFGYQTVHFDAGSQWMDGDRALQYARSRHGDNEEGSDFARAARQQKLIAALKDKVMSLDLLNDEQRLQEVIEAINQHYETNLTLKEMLALAAFAKNLTSANIHSMVLKEGPGELLYTPDDETRNQYYQGMAILLPDGNSFQNICRNIESYLKDPSILDSGVQVEVLNGSGKIGLANKVATLLMQNGYKVYPVYGVRNTSYGTYEQSYLYDHSPEQANLFIIEKLQNLLGIKRVLDKNSEPNYHEVGITIVLGKDFYLEGLDQLYEGQASIKLPVDLNTLAQQFKAETKIATEMQIQ